MFHQAVVFASVLAVGLCVIVQDPAPVPPSAFDISPDGSFEWSYQSDDGSSQRQSGREIAPEGGQAIDGEARWYDPEGGLHELKYVADERGYLPTSADLPVGPPIPPAILRAVEWNLAHPEEDPKA